MDQHSTLHPFHHNFTDKSHGQLENISQPEQQISVAEDSHSEDRNSIQKDLKETVGIVGRPLTDFNRSEFSSNGGSPFKVPNPQSENTLYTCDICNKTFSKKSNLNAHIRIHSGDKPYLCEVCNASFKHKSSLVTHARKHTGERPFVCTECSASFRDETVLKNHKRIHTGEKPFVCEECGATFRQKFTLLRHARRHTGEKPYSCKKCRKSFSLKCNMQSHERRCRNVQ